MSACCEDEQGKFPLNFCNDHAIFGCKCSFLKFRHWVSIFCIKIQIVYKSSMLSFPKNSVLANHSAQRIGYVRKKIYVWKKISVIGLYLVTKIEKFWRTYSSYGNTFPWGSPHTAQSKSWSHNKFCFVYFMSYLILKKKWLIFYAYTYINSFHALQETLTCRGVRGKKLGSCL